MYAPRPSRHISARALTNCYTTRNARTSCQLILSTYCPFRVNYINSLVIVLTTHNGRSVAGWCMSTFVNTRFASFVFVYVAQSTISRSLCPFNFQIFQRRSSDMRPHSALLEGKRCAAHLRPINAPSSWLCNHSWCSRASEG